MFDKIAQWTTGQYKLFKVEYWIFGQIPENKLCWFQWQYFSKFIDYQILANTLVLRLKKNENIIDIIPIDILLMVRKSAIFVWHPGPETILNSTYVLHRKYCRLSNKDVKIVQ